MTLQKSDHALSLVAACGCKTGGCMTLPKSAFRWLHEAANRQTRAMELVIATSLTTKRDRRESGGALD